MKSELFLAVKYLVTGSKVTEPGVLPGREAGYEKKGHLGP